MVISNFVKNTTYHNVFAGARALFQLTLHLEPLLVHTFVTLSALLSSTVWPAWPEITTQMYTSIAVNGVAGHGTNRARTQPRAHRNPSLERSFPRVTTTAYPPPIPCSSHYLQSLLSMTRHTTALLVLCFAAAVVSATSASSSTAPVTITTTSTPTPPTNATRLGKVHASCSLNKAVPEETCEVTGLPLIGDIGLDVKANVTALSLEAYIVYKGKYYKILGLDAHNPAVCENIEVVKVSSILSFCARACRRRCRARRSRNGFYFSILYSRTVLQVRGTDSSTVLLTSDTHWIPFAN